MRNVPPSSRSYAASGAGCAPGALNQRGATKSFQSTNAIATTASASHTLFHAKERCDALPSSDACRRYAISAASLAQVVQRRQRQPRARRAERMTQGDRAAVRIELRAIVGHLAKARDDLRRERLVDLHHGQIAGGNPCALECFWNRKSGTDAHDGRID